MIEFPRSILVTGATSAVGQYLLPALLARGSRVYATSRGPATVTGVRWLQGELKALGPGLLLSESCALVHLAPIFTLPAVLPAWLATGRLQRLVVLSSTSVLTKQLANSTQDRRLAQALAVAEQSVVEFCSRAAIPYTVLRPTLIYGGSRKGGLGYIRDFICRFGFFPIAGQGMGLRQPVHAEDVAWACEQVLLHAATVGRIYQLPGGEVLTYREMVKRIFIAQQRRPRLLSTPVGFARLALACLRVLPGYRGLSPAMAERMNQDMSFDYSEATRDFGFQPRGFSGSL